MRRRVRWLIYITDDASYNQVSLQVERFGSIDEARVSMGLGCLAVEEADSLDELLAAFGRSASDVLALADSIRREVREHSR